MPRTIERAREIAVEIGEVRIAALERNGSVKKAARLRHSLDLVAQGKGDANATVQAVMLAWDEPE